MTDSDNNCPFVDFGCDYHEDLQHLRKHIKQTPAKHLSLLCDGVSSMFNALRHLQLDFEDEERFSEITEYRIRALDVIFSSHLIWRIDNVKDRMQKAKDGVEPSIFSPPFYTGKNGYKMALSLVWRGDGEGKGKYVSLFISILKGEFDSLLSWPYSQPLSLTLIDQRHGVHSRKNVVQLVTPNVCKENRPFLDRPHGDRNPRFGLQKFVEIKELHSGDYVTDDTVFIKVDVDTQHSLAI